MKPNYIVVTIILVFLISLSFWTHWNEKQQYLNQSKDSLIFSHALSSCDEIKVSNKNNHLWLVNKLDGWEIKKPVQDLASLAGVQSFLKPLQSQRYTYINSNSDLEKFGLKDPLMSFYARCGNKMYNLKFSEQMGPGRVHYILSDGQVLVGNTAWKQLLAFNVSYLRDSYILPEISNIETVSIYNSKYKEPLKIYKEDNKWRSEQFNDLSTKQVNKYLRGLSDLTAQSFYSDYISKKLLTETNVLDPLLKIVISYKDKANNEKNWTLSLGNNDDQYFIVTSSRNSIFQITNKDANNMLWNENDFLTKENDSDQSNVSHSN